MKTPLRYPGGKSRAVKHILPYIPEDCGELCSPFLGGGSIELAVAERKGTTAVYGYDLFEPVVWFWHAMLSDPNTLTASIEQLRSTYTIEEKGIQKQVEGLSNDDFIQLRKDLAKVLKDKTGFSYVNAAKFFAINRASFSGATFSGGWSKKASYARFNDSSIGRVKNFKEPKLKVKCADFKKSIAQHQDAFLYCDPPYFLGKDRDRLYGINGSTHLGFDHRGLYDILSQRGKWVLSYNNCEEIRDLYKGYKIFEASWAYGMKNVSKESRENKKMGESSEIIIIGK